MKKKILLVMILVLTTLVLTLVFAPFSTPVYAGGTCCPQFIAICVVDGKPIEHYYFAGTGPCPED